MKLKKLKLPARLSASQFWKTGTWRLCASILPIMAAIVTAMVCYLNRPPAFKVGAWIPWPKTYISRSSPADVAELCLESGISYLVVKTSDAGKKVDFKNPWHPQCPKELFLDLLKECHLRGIKVYAFAYVYGSSLDFEVLAGKAALDAGADGYVLNAEKEIKFKDRLKNVVSLARKLRAYSDEQGHQPLFLSTFGRCTAKTAGNGIDFRQMAPSIDQFWPQDYWADWTGPHKGHWDPAASVGVLDKQWDKNPLARNLPSRVYTGHSINRLHKPVPASELDAMLSACRKAGYREANVWALDSMQSTHLAVVRRYTGLEPLPKIVSILLIISGMASILLTWVLSDKKTNKRLGTALLVAGWLVVVAGCWPFLFLPVPQGSSLSSENAAATSSETSQPDSQWEDKELATERQAVSQEKGLKRGIKPFRTWKEIAASHRLVPMRDLPDLGLQVASDMGKHSPHPEVYCRLDSRFWGVIKQLAAAWKEEGGSPIKVNSGVRSVSYEVHAHLPITSTYHTRGLATDLVLVDTPGKPVFNSEEGRRFLAFLHQQAGKLGVNFYTEEYDGRCHVHLFLATRPPK